jgi:hypothetical protein
MLLKIFYLISPQQEHFRMKFQLILEATVQGYNFGICIILGNWSCDHIPTTCLMDPDLSNHPYLVFLHFLVRSDEISLLGYIQRTLIWTLNTVPDDICHQYFSLKFCDFSTIFLLETLNFLFWTYTLDPDNNT